jgi:hypothetical protein
LPSRGEFLTGKPFVSCFSEKEGVMIFQVINERSIMTDEAKDVKKEEPKNPAKGKPPSLMIPLIKVPNDTEFLEKELQEMFDEDKVTHKHGNAEPESD